MLYYVLCHFIYIFFKYTESACELRPKPFHCEGRPVPSNETYTGRVFLCIYIIYWATAILLTLPCPVTTNYNQQR